MGLAATGSKKLLKDIARATGQELTGVGVNWILGPLLNVSSNARNQPLGVRIIGDDPSEVSSYGVEFLRGYHEAGLATCGKHFPSNGNLDFLEAPPTAPTRTESTEQLNQSALLPFRTAIMQGLDAVMIDGVTLASTYKDAMQSHHSEQLIDDLLRTEMAFNGIVICNCVEMQALRHNIGIESGTIMAFQAGCDNMLLCRSFTVQREAINGLRSGVENGLVQRSKVETSVRRVLEMKSRCTSWEKALNPAGISYLSQLQPLHAHLSSAAYDGSITVVRDQKRLLPISNLLNPDAELLLLTPLLKPLPASAACRLMNESPSGTTNEQICPWGGTSAAMSGESVFLELGRAMSRRRKGRILHTSYTANGLRPLHEDLINRAGVVVVVTADAGRNLYQNGFTKHVSMICRRPSISDTTSNGEHKEKSCIVVSVTSPFDFASDLSIGTYICTYDFTEMALQSLVRVLYGELMPTGSLPGSLRSSPKIQKSKPDWLVEDWNEERDLSPLDMLLRSSREKGSASEQLILSGVSPNTFLLRSNGIKEAHFVVRNSSTKELYGFCSTYYYPSTRVGMIGAILVDPNRRRLSIGHSLHHRAVHTLTERLGIQKLQLGSRAPSVFLGIPISEVAESKRLKQWFVSMGWKAFSSQTLLNMILPKLPTWSPPEGLSHTVSNPDIKFDLIYGTEYSETVLAHVKENGVPGVLEIYKLALADKTSCGIIRAKRCEDGFLLASLVLYKNDSRLAQFVPALADTRVLAGGISSPVISPVASDSASLMQGLILLGIRQIRKQGASAVVLDCVRFSLLYLQLNWLILAD